MKIDFLFLSNLDYMKKCKFKWIKLIMWF